METYSANNWNDNFQPNRISPFEDKEKRNKKMIQSAEFHAQNMKESPSYLEKMMMEFLNNHHIKYEFQKIYYIKKSHTIQRYFIVDFYVPHANLIIETDGKFHNEQIDYDNQRTLIIKQHFGKIKVLRFNLDDFHNGKLEELLLLVKASSYRKVVRADKRQTKQKKKAEAEKRKKKIKALHT